MRSVIKLILLFFVFSAASAQDFVLKGELSGFDDGTRIILNPFLDNMDVDMDNETQLVLKDGKFEFSQHLDKPTKFSLRVRPKDPDNIVEFEELMFWSENLPMTLHGAKGKVFQSTVQGSRIQDQYFQYVLSVAELQRMSKQIVDSVKTLPGLGEDRKSGMRVRFHAALKTIEEKRLEFTFAHPDYLCAGSEVVWYLTFQPGKVDQKELKEFYAQMSTAGLSNNTYGKQIGIALKGDTAILKALELGDYPYNFTLKDISGNEIKFSSINNKVILLDFWGSGCGPCRLEHKNYSALYHEFKNSGFEIVSVSQDQSKKKMMEAIKQDKMLWICLWDESKKVSNSLYGISALPSTYLIMDGKIVAINLRGDELRRKLEEVFDGRGN